jgi:hypothetical protein
LTKDYGVRYKSTHIVDNEKGGGSSAFCVAADVGLAA